MENKYKKGDKVIIIDNTCSHGYKHGETIIIASDPYKMFKNTVDYYLCSNVNTGKIGGYITERDITSEPNSSNKALDVQVPVFGRRRLKRNKN